MNLKQAIDLLGEYTDGRYNVWALTGPANAAFRVRLMCLLTGREKMPKSAAGVNALREAFYAEVKPQGNCPVVRERVFAAYCRKVECSGVLA